MSLLRIRLAYRRFVRPVFHRHLLTFNIVSSGVLMGLGDILQQMNEKSKGPFNHQRLMRMFIVGMIEGPLHHFYYTRLDIMLPGRDAVTVFKKIVLDQIVASPLFITTFFYGMGILEGSSLKKCTDDLRRDLPTVYFADCCVWPPTQFLNFYFVPGPYRVLYINVVTTFYNVFLSYMKHRDVNSINVKKTNHKLEESLD